MIFVEFELDAMTIGQSKTYFCSDTGRRITLFREHPETYGLSVKGGSVPHRIIVTCSRDDINAIARCCLTGSFQ